MDELALSRVCAYLVKSLNEFIVKRQFLKLNNTKSEFKMEALFHFLLNVSQQTTTKIPIR